jgi:threonine/homoserine/homoserine lactone efflux protein
VTGFLIALLPSLGVLFIFWIGIRALVQADRRERAAQARIEAAERLRNRAATASGQDLPVPGTGTPSNNVDS